MAVGAQEVAVPDAEQAQDHRHVAREGSRAEVLVHGAKAREHLLEPLTRKYFFEFKRCSGCGKVYWPGSHIERIEMRLEHILPPGTFPNLSDEINF